MEDGSGLRTAAGGGAVFSFTLRSARMEEIPDDA
jgi:hypothetical protein